MMGTGLGVDEGTDGKTVAGEGANQRSTRLRATDIPTPTPNPSFMLCPRVGRSTDRVGGVAWKEPGATGAG